MEDGECRGVIALEMATAGCTASAPTRPFSRRAATGGTTSPAPRPPAPATATPLLRAGLPLQDMEFVQFHPTGIYGAGCPPDHRGVRGRAATSQPAGERFTERYAPNADTMRRPSAMTIEIREGRGVGSHDHIHLHLEHLGPDVIRTAAGHRRDGAYLCRRRRHARTDPGPADRALQHGRHPPTSTARS